MTVQKMPSDSEQRRPRVFAYGREVFIDDLPHVDEQRQICLQEFQRLAVTSNGAPVEWAGWFEDSYREALKPWVDRRGGRAVLRLMRPGDCLIVACAEFLYHFIKTGSMLFKRLEREGIRVQVLNMPYDLQSEDGRLFLWAMHTRAATLRPHPCTESAS